MSRILPILFNSDMVQATLDDRKTVTRRSIKYSHHDVYKYACLHGMWYEGASVTSEMTEKYVRTKKMPCQPGDILYVRETWNYMYDLDGNDQIIEETGRYVYYADNPNPCSCWVDPDTGIHRDAMPWRPSIHMPKAAARIWLRVTDVRVEQLQDITDWQAIREGISKLYDDLSDAKYLDWAKRTGVYPKTQEEWGYKNYLWHGNFGTHGMGNKMSDAWDYQYSCYDSARDSFSSLWNTTVPLKDWSTYGWAANPWIWAIEFERCKKTGGGIAI